MDPFGVRFGPGPAHPIGACSHISGFYRSKGGQDPGQNRSKSGPKVVILDHFGGQIWTHLGDPFWPVACRLTRYSTQIPGPDLGQNRSKSGPKVVILVNLGVRIWAPNSALQKWYFGPPKRGPIHTESPSNGVPDLANLSPKPDPGPGQFRGQIWLKSGQFGPLLGSNMDPFGDRLLAGSMPAHKVFDPNSGSRSEPEPVPTGSYGFEVLVGGYS